MLGAKIDARLNLLERKLVDLTHRLERLEKPVEMVSLPVVTLPEVLREQVEMAPSEPKRRGRPPKVKNG